MIHQTAERGFNINADIYETIRPDFHPELINIFCGIISKGVTVELGSGTGKFTKHLLEAGYSLISIEPVEQMRSKLTAKFPSLNVLGRTAENTELQNQSVDTVVAAQAFHWFDYRSALAEIKRILKPGGILVCVWNVRNEEVEWVNKYEETLNKYAGNAPRHRTMKWRKAIDNDSSFKLIGEWLIENPQPTTSEGVVQRALSTSFIAVLEDDVQDKVLNKIREIVSPLGNKFEFPYRSEMQAWRKS